MANLNKVFLMGNLTRDPEIRYTQSGPAVANFGLAINRTFKRQDGQQQEDTCFVDITAWGRQAEVIAEYCSKGRPLFVEGRLQFDQWDDKNTGARRSKLNVVLESFQFLGGRRDDGAGPPARSQSQYSSSPPQHSSPPPQQAAPPPQHSSPPPQQAAPPRAAEPQYAPPPPPPPSDTPPPDEPPPGDDFDIEDDKIPF